MSDQYVGEIRMFAGSYAPEGWNFCDGTVLQVVEYQALFALIGARYGGDGRTTFALPDLRGRLPIGQGQGAGLTNRPISSKGGAETVTLDITQLPSHTHVPNASNGPGSQLSPQNGVWASISGATNFITSAEVKSPSIIGQLNEKAIDYTAGGVEHNNVMPSLPVSFIIALQGIFPVRP